MIEATLLRQLGWREELIQEVTRVADAIRCTTPSISLTASPPCHPRYQSGSSLFADVTPFQPVTLTGSHTTPNIDRIARSTRPPSGRKKRTRR